MAPSASPGKFRSVKASLADLTGKEYVEAVCASHAALTRSDRRSALRLATRKVNFYPAELERALTALLPKVGTAASPPLRRSAAGRATAAFEGNTRRNMAPLTGLGWFRISEDGRLRLLAKSEHYHAPLGHSFPGYDLIARARALGIPNATHNNTRGHVTRVLEEALIAAASRADAASGAGALDRVLNLETGSLAVEAAIKMMLSRFHKAQGDSPEPKYAGRLPVFVVIGDDEGDLSGNYHGTTVVAQILRGMWGTLRAQLEKSRILKVRAIRPNNGADLAAVFGEDESPPYKIAGFFHELIMMNYGGRRMSPAFLKKAYALCRRHDVPTLADEIQSCLWAPGLFMIHEYGLRPDFIAVGKGFPGGEYPASRILFNSAMDCLPQFGALVTNGQEELASLAYLITMRWALENAEAIRAVGDYYEEKLHGLARECPGLIQGIEGRRHLGAICFADLGTARAFTSRLTEGGLDISVQAYKANCPPAALTKLPIIANRRVVDFVVGRMREAAKAVMAG